MRPDPGTRIEKSLGDGYGRGLSDVVGLRLKGEAENRHGLTLHVTGELHKPLRGDLLLPLVGAYNLLNEAHIHAVLVSG